MRPQDEQLIEIEFEGQPSGEVFAWFAGYFLLLLALLVWGVLSTTCSEAVPPAQAGGTIGESAVLEVPRL